MSMDEREPKASESMQIPIGFDAPGIFAGFLGKNIENGVAADQILDNFMLFQDQGHVTCTQCSLIFPITIWNRRDVIRLLQAAQKLDRLEFRQMVAKEYHDYVFECPSCGLRAHLRDNA